MIDRLPEKRRRGSEMHQRSDRTTGTRGLMEGWHTEQVAESQAGHDQAGLKNVAKKEFSTKAA